MTTLRLLAAMTFAFTLTIPVNGASFQGLGDLPGGIFDSRAFGVSADGSVVVGQSRSATGVEAFRWTAETGMVGLGYLPGGFESVANAISDDATTVVGYSRSPAGYQAFHWNFVDGIAGLWEGIVFGTSADGRVIAGESAGHAVRWTEDEGLVQLTDLPSDAFGVSADGSVITGYHIDAAFRWTSETGIVAFTGSILDTSEGRAITPDGKTIVGYGYPGGLIRPLRYVDGGDVTYLAGDAPGQSLRAWDVSADGSVVVGGPVQEQGQAFLWDEANGMRRLRNILANQGLDTTGWALREARGISADGRTIVGWGRNPAGQTEAWIAVVPEPSSLALFAASAAGLSTLRKKRRTHL